VNSLFGAQLPNRSVVDEMTTHRSSVFTSCDLYFVSMTATAENPISYNYVIKGGKPFIDLSDKLG
jgi:hypothetical protein